MAAVEGLIEGPLARALEAAREPLNARFAEARLRLPGLEAGRFASHLRQTVAPIIAAVDAAKTGSVHQVLEVLYGLSLELMGAELLGPQARYPALDAGWRELLPAVAPLLAAQPQRVASSLSNALYNLSVTAGARPEEWLESMVAAAAGIADVDTLLQAGQVAAWRRGMAHYREAALDLLAGLPAPQACLALGLPPQPTLDGTELAGRLRANPWHTTETLLGRQTPTLGVVAVVGGFRGYGGPFLTPPRIDAADGELYLRDAESSWLLRADGFGSALHRLDQAPAPARQPDLGGFSIDHDGTVRRGELTASIPKLGGHASAAGNETTLAVSLPYSHRVFLLGVGHALDR